MNLESQNKHQRSDFNKSWNFNLPSFVKYAQTSFNMSSGSLRRAFSSAFRSSSSTFSNPVFTQNTGNPRYAVIDSVILVKFE